MAYHIMLWHLMLSMFCHVMIWLWYVWNQSALLFYAITLYYATPHYMMHVGVSPNVCRSVCLPFTFSLGSSSVGVGSHRSWLWVAIAHTYTLAIGWIGVPAQPFWPADFTQTFWEWWAMGMHTRQAEYVVRRVRGSIPNMDVYDVC